MTTVNPNAKTPDAAARNTSDTIMLTVAFFAVTSTLIFCPISKRLVATGCISTVLSAKWLEPSARRPDEPPNLNIVRAGVVVT
jgi:hypothetical protein